MRLRVVKRFISPLQRVKQKFKPVRLPTENIFFVLFTFCYSLFAFLSNFRFHL